MKIVVSSDVFGYALKETVKKHLTGKGHDVLDVGPRSEDDALYYVEATCRLCREITEGDRERGLLFCGTGAGVGIAANKHKGIYCVPCESAFTAFKAAQINDANVISMGINVVGPGNACQIADTWLESRFAQGGDDDRKAFLTSLLDQLYEMERINFDE
jgi:ribose 5-phosphate isomerase B